MKKLTFKAPLLLAIAFFTASVSAQTLLTKTVYKNDTADFGAGGTVSVTGAPRGSITVEGWDKNEIEISAEIEIQAPTEADLAKLSEVSGFAIDSSFNTLRIISVGTFDKDYMKRTAKKFQKNLLAMPLSISYKLKVPRYCDLNITGGRGDFALKGVDGALTVNYLDTNAKIELPGGSVQATFGVGTVEIAIPTRNWRGRFADVAMTNGTMKLRLPAGLNAEFEAAILRTGTIENTFTELKPKVKKIPFTDKSISARAGNGGIPLKFTVGDGTMSIAAY